MPGSADRAEWTDYELLDAGEGRRLERFGDRIVDRPASMALDWKSVPEEWRRADLRFDGSSRWQGTSDRLEPWQIGVGDGLVMELRPTASGGLGIYPEHVANLAWVADRVRGGEVAGRGGQPPAVLNLFAHTGLVTLAAALAGGAVAHVDAAKGSVAWARRNAELSGLADRPIRWLVDDALSFVAREARRGRRYDGIVLDPPSFGRAKQGRRSHAWRLEDELPELLDACAALATDDSWVLLTAHTEGLDGDQLEGLLVDAFPARRSHIETTRLAVAASPPGMVELDLGWAVRLSSPARQ